MSDYQSPAEPIAAAPIPPIPGPGSPRRTRWTRIAILGGVLVGGIALGAGGLAAAAGQHGWMQGGPRIERMQAMARRTLDSVGATSDQEAKVHDIIAATFGDLAPARERNRDFRAKMAELLKAPTLDMAAIEKLRADHIADIDGDSKRITKAVTDVAGVLTADQRVKVVDRIEAFMARGPHRQWGHGMGGGRGWGHRGGQGHDGPGGGDRPGDDGSGQE